MGIIKNQFWAFGEKIRPLVLCEISPILIWGTKIFKFSLFFHPIFLIFTQMSSLFSFFFSLFSNLLMIFPHIPNFVSIFLIFFFISSFFLSFFLFLFRFIFSSHFPSIFSPDPDPRILHFLQLCRIVPPQLGVVLVMLNMFIGNYSGRHSLLFLFLWNICK